MKATAFLFSSMIIPLLKFLLEENIHWKLVLVEVAEHPSWRNTGWLKRNPWFHADLLPALREAVAARLDAG